MITFVTTFPPIICGIGTYTKYVLDHIPPAYWKVISFNLDEFSISDESLAHKIKDRVDFCLLFPNPSLPSLDGTNFLWFQHSFGMWGNVNDHFLGLLKEAKSRKIKTAASFHTIHFQSTETPSGMTRQEEELLRETLSFLDVATVFTDGAYNALIDFFPEYADKIVVLRHGVHLYPRVSQQKARSRLYSYLVNQAEIPHFQKDELRKIEADFYSNSTILLGNYGFITSDKAPLHLYELGKLVRQKLSNYRVITLFAGIIQGRKDGTPHKYRPIIESMYAGHDGKENFFFEVYIPEEIFQLAMRALDFAVFWCNNATQSGRMAHSQGTGTLVVGRNIEGVGETLKLSGLTAAESLIELAENIVDLVLDSKLRKEATDQNRQYAQQYCFANQAKKHLLIEKALATGADLPDLDGKKNIQIKNHVQTRPEMIPAIQKDSLDNDFLKSTNTERNSQGEGICTLQ